MIDIVHMINKYSLRLRGAFVNIPKGWTAADYLLRNQFCPPSNIQDRLEWVRIRSASKTAILVAHDGTTFLQTLFFASNSNPEAERQQLNDLQRSILHVPEGTSSLTDETVLQFLSKTTRDKGIAELYAHSLVEAAEYTPGIRAWLLTTRQVNRRALESSQLIDMLNGTAIANIRRDQKINNLIREQATGPINESAAVDAYLEIATSVVSGTLVAAYYTAADDAPGLRLERTSVPFSNLNLELPKFVPYAANASSSGTYENYIRRAYTDSSTYVHPSPYAAVHREPATIAAMAFAALPVQVAPIGRDHPNLGVLAVWRTQTNARGPAELTVFELALLRNVALRLSLSTALHRMSRAGTLLGRFSKRLSASTMETEGQLDRQTKLEGAPWDAETARLELQQLASYIRETTSSFSVTMRVLVTKSTDQGAQLYLRRFVADPIERLSDEDEDIRVTGSWRQQKGKKGRPFWQESANAFCVTKNQIVYLWDLDRPTQHQCKELLSVKKISSRIPIRSELCIPIIADNAVIGTMNLESPQPYAYSTQLSMAEAFAALAGVAVTAVRREIVQQVSRRFSRLRIGHHEAKNIKATLDNLRTQIGDAHEDSLKSLEALTLAQGFTKRGTKYPLPETNLREIVRACTSKSKLDDAVAVRVPADLELQPPSAGAVAEAVKEIVHNMQKHSTLDHAVNTVRAQRLVLGGRDHVMVTFRSRPGPINRSVLLTLYRAPIPDQSGSIRPHLGCFVAGELIRSVDGNIFADLTEDGLLETNLFVPIMSEGKLTDV